MGRKRGSKNKVKKIIDPTTSAQGDQKPIYFVSFSVNGQELKTTGNTLLEAMRELKPDTFKTKGILKVVYGDKKVDRILNIPQMKKLFLGDLNSFTKKVAMESTVKYLSTMLK